ncbi:glutaminyl-peptide cyclotransferase isoform X3 [Vigna umbellata]|uniref:glutaminyl-peptide cyclotransferase isoform X3 n=1 Tax=Vigna umbellata TaxID=87088 RepID=UPI001F5FA79D|nr:glutaminyl-peptide cyclotransferase isoform X3 [Vigna umbellata]
MGTKLLKRRLRESQNPPMAAAVPPRRKPRSYVTLSMLLSAVLIVSVIALLVLSSNNWRAFQSRPSYGTVTVVNVFPHDPEAFTQGLVYDRNDTLFESTGLYGRSSVRKVSLHTGKVEDIQKMDSSIFGEGLTLLNNRLFQVTWLQKAGFIYDPKNLSQTDCIARISPNDGSVLGWVLLQNLRKGLMEAGNNNIDVLNGIAWDDEQKRIFVTGKLWPKLYEIKVSPVKKPIEEGIIEQLCLRRPFKYP